ncbi:MAG: hypothetical protein KDK48_03260 [Chlamydiia bacterium]|nr:hypothetical protein [Chlamydiia bacterium]
MGAKKHYFYDKPILADQEHEYIESLLKKYKHEDATEELQKKIWDELQWEKHLGNISIPFKVVLRKDEYGRYPPSVEVILDTKL